MANGLLASLTGGLVADKKKEDEWRRMFGLPELSQVDGSQSPMSAGIPAQPEKLSWQEGGKMGWKDGLSLALAGIGDAFTRQGGGEGNALSTMMGNAMNARNASRKASIDAAKDQELTQRMIDVGVQNNMTPEQVMAQKYGLELPKAAEPKEWEDNAGNRWRMGQGGQPEPVWVDPNDKQTMVTSGDGSVRFAPQPNALRGSRYDKPIGALTALPDGPPAGQTPPPRNTPSGSPLAGNGGAMPPSRSITTAQFQQEVRRRGVAGASEWLQANNISIRN